MLSQVPMQQHCLAGSLNGVHTMIFNNYQHQQGWPEKGPGKVATSFDQNGVIFGLPFQCFSNRLSQTFH